MAIRGPFPATLTIPDHETAVLLLESVNQWLNFTQKRASELVQAMRTPGPPKPGEDEELAGRVAKRDALEKLLSTIAGVVGDDS